MTITSIEALESVPEGTEVIVGSDRWTRTAAGMQASNGITLGLSAFPAFIQRGVVRQTGVTMPTTVEDFTRFVDEGLTTEFMRDNLPVGTVFRLRSGGASRWTIIMQDGERMLLSNNNSDGRARQHLDTTPIDGHLVVESVPSVPPVQRQVMPPIEGLRLAVVSTDYHRDSSPPSTTRREPFWTSDNPDDRTFYVQMRGLEPCLVVPGNDPRHEGMWSHRFPGLTGEVYGWNISQRYLTWVDEQPVIEPGTAVTLEVLRALPIGSTIRSTRNAESEWTVQPDEVLDFNHGGSTMFTTITLGNLVVDRVGPEVTWTLGQSLSPQDLDRVPVGSIVNCGGMGHLIKRGDGWTYRYTGGMVRAERLAEETYTIIGLPDGQLAAPVTPSFEPVDTSRLFRVRLTQTANGIEAGTEMWARTYDGGVALLLHPDAPGAARLWRDDSGRTGWVGHVFGEGVQHRAWYLDPGEFTRVTPEQPTPVTPEGVGEALNEYLREQDGLTGEERDGLVSIMERFGIEVAPQTEEVEVTINVTGTYDTYADSEFAEMVGGGVDVDMPQVTIEWSRSFEHTFTVDDGECACSEVNRGLVETLLDEAGVSYSSFDYETECRND